MTQFLSSGAAALRSRLSSVCAPRNSPSVVRDLTDAVFVHGQNIALGVFGDARFRHREAHGGVFARLRGFAEAFNPVRELFDDQLLALRNGDREPVGQGKCAVARFILLHLGDQHRCPVALEVGKSRDFGAEHRRREQQDE